MARNRYLRRDTFRQFLVEAGDDVVGVTRRSRECPVATHLEKLTNRTWNVSALACVPQVTAESDEDQFDLRHEFKPPRWARDFIRALDKHYLGWIEVTGNQALYVLDEAVS